MADAVFTIHADITPQIDERELQRQAQVISGQINGLLSKQIEKVSISPQTGQFRPFEREVDKARGVLERFQDGLGGIPRSISNIARSGRSAFLKFTDAINVTRREFVGFGKGIRDTIRDTNLFESALDGIKATGSSIQELPEQFEVLSAQIRSGTDAVSQMAASGNQLAQLFQPLQIQGEAARTEFVELNESIDQLVQVVTRFAAASGKGIDVTRDDFDLLGTSVNNLEKPFFRVQAILNETGTSTSEFGKHLRATFQGAAGDPERLVEALIALRNETQKTAGPLGFLAQILGKVTEEERAAAKAVRLELNASLIELGRGDAVSGVQRLAAQFALLRDRVTSFVNFFAPVGRGLAQFGTQGVASITSIGNAITSSLLGRFPQFRNEALSAEEAMNKFIGGASNLDIAAGRIQESLNKTASSFGNFLGKNLIGPLKAAGPQIKQAFSTIGRDFANGFGIGIDQGKTPIARKAGELAHSALNTLRRILKTGSPSKETIKTGIDTGVGFAQGIESTRGRVGQAMASLGQGLSALNQQVSQFARSVALVAGTAIAGLGAAALATGKEFNVLKQVINASLPVIVGSRKAAAGLLEEVNALNDSSPFARSTFLELTRVLAGFGVQVEKITPLIDAIQQTVAATGGSDQDILELGNAFARLQSQGRVSLDVLQSFTTRGVDAVAILAEGFGKTTSEMRKMISDGLVPANKAINILTEGLKERFDGATDAVARNFPGALQRVQARLRDIGGTLLTAFITPEGGGALVTFLNNMADTLSHLNRELLPRLAPLLQKAADALVIISEKVEGFVKSISGDEFEAFIDKLKPWAPVLAGLAGLIPAAFGFIPVIGPIIAGLGGPFTAAAAAIGVFLAQTGQFGNVMDGVSESLGNLGSTASQVLTFFKDNLAGVALVALGTIATLKNFVTSAGAFVGFFSAGIPIIGQLGGAFQGVTKLFGTALAPLTKLSAGFTGLLGAIPKVGGILAKLSGPIGIAITIFTQLVLTSQRFREALGRLFEAVKPVAAVIGQVLATAIKILDGAVAALEPVFTVAVNLLAQMFEGLGPIINGIQKFLGFLQKHEIIEKFFAILKKSIEVAIDIINRLADVIDKVLGPFINLPEIKVEVDADPAVKEAKKAAEEWKKQQAAIRKAAEDSAAAVEDNYNAATKAVENATKAQSDAIDQMRQAIDTAAGIINGVITAAQAVQSAQAAVTAARTKEAEASAEITKLQKDYARALEDTITPARELAQAERNLRDIQRSKTALDREEQNLIKENLKLRQDLVDLQGEEAQEDREALARGEERAIINLNRAKQAQLDLENELNNAGKVSIDLTGLSLDQIRGQLAAARAAAKARGRNREKTPQELADERRSAQLDVEDAQAGVEEAQEARAEFEIETNEKINETKEKIRDNDERILEIADDRVEVLEDEQEQLKRIERLRAGETAQQQIILDFDNRIKDAKEVQKQAAQAIDTATKGAAIAQAEFRLKTAEAKGDVDGILRAQQDLWALQGGDLFRSNSTLRDIMGQQLSNVRQARDAAREMTAELIKANKLLGAASALQGLSSSAGRVDTAKQSFENALATNNEPAQIKFGTALNKAQDETIKALRTALNAGAAELRGSRAGEPWLPSPGQVEAVIRGVLERLARTGNLRDAIRDALVAAGVSMPGFAAARGLSPGMIHRGMNNGVGLVRMFEYGKEAVLPLTRPMDMARIVRDPRVLPAVMKALPGFARGFAPGQRIITEALTSPNSPLRRLLQDIFEQMGLQFPGFATGYAPGDLGNRVSSANMFKPFNVSDFASSSLSPILNALPRWSAPTPDSKVTLADTSVSDLSSVVSATRRGGGPANADVYEKKSQREFADTIGEAVRVAVKSALEESDGLGERNATINVNPNASETQRMIAREVKRQLDKRTGKW